MPTYKPNIPQPTDQQSQSQDDILQNFQQINTAFSVNHVAFNTPNTQGFHSFINLLTAVPTQTTNVGGNQVGLYSNTGPQYGGSATVFPELFFQRNNLGASAGIPISQTGSATILGITINFAYLPSGVIVKYGTATTGITGQATINLSGTGLPSYGVNFFALCAPGINSGALSPSPFNYGATIVQSTQQSSFIVQTFTTNTGAALANVPITFFAIGI